MNELENNKNCSMEQVINGAEFVSSYRHNNCMRKFTLHQKFIKLPALCEEDPSYIKDFLGIQN